jgi:hypothetical protein
MDIDAFMGGGLIAAFGWLCYFLGILRGRLIAAREIRELLAMFPHSSTASREASQR